MDCLGKPDAVVSAASSYLNQGNEGKVWLLKMEDVRDQEDFVLIRLGTHSVLLDFIYFPSRSLHVRERLLVVSSE